jgi:hypothetical protein
VEEETVPDAAGHDADPASSIGGRRPRVVVVVAALVAAALVLTLVLSDVLRWEEPRELAAGEYLALAGDPGSPLRVGLRGTTVDEVPWETSVSWWTRQPEPVSTFGVQLCVAGGGEVTVVEVAALEPVGQGFRDLGVHVRRFGEGDATGWEPGRAQDLPGRGVPAEGAQLTQPCGAAPATEELLVTLEATDERGGGWRGVAVDYTAAGGTAHRLEVPAELLMCGTASEPCGW